jgi:hypothetical protein
MSGAVISDCGRYRYTLTRVIPQPVRWVKPALFIMLNPSTADATEDDPTIRRCIAFAAREGCTRLTVVNLFALRATDPAELARAADPIGPENDRHIREQIGTHHAFGRIFVAWGAHPIARMRAEWVRQEFAQVFDLCCLGTSKFGAPRHPLYIKRDAPLEHWR